MEDKQTEFSQSLAVHVAEHLFQLQSDHVYSSNEILYWLLDQHEPKFTNINAFADEIVSANKIKLSNFTFESFDERDPPLWIEVLAKIRNIHFESCIFECEKLTLKDTAFWFDRCQFGTRWFVSVGRNTSALTEPGDALFEECEFPGSVLIGGADIDEETLGRYELIFGDCNIKDLILDRVTVPKRLYSAIPSLPDFIASDRHGTKKGLESLMAFFVIFKKSLDLKHYHVGEVFFENATFREGGNLSGFTCESLLFSSCNIEGRFDFSRGEAKKVRFTDCHFERSAIFDGSKAEVFLFSASSFDHVLSMEEAEVSKCISLRSCPFGKPPNFLNCNLSDEVIRTADRETFRIIKNSFDSVGNNLEANRYYAFEMNAYLTELRDDSKGMFFERWLLELNGFLSEHGQNYWRPLAGILMLPVLYWLAGVSYREQWLYGLDTRLDYLLQNLAMILNGYARSVVWFLPDNAKGIEFIALLLGVLLSTLVWHFLVAVRRHKRR